MSGRMLSRSRFLSIAGVKHRWIYATWVGFAAFVALVRWNGGQADVAPYLFFFLVPIAACTGVLTQGRRGALDLLLGAGESRSAIWRTAFLRSWVWPSMLAVLLLLLSGPLTKQFSLAESIPRLIAVLLFTGGVSFAAGLVEPRFVVPVVWLLLRLIFVMVPSFLTIIMRLAKGIDPPTMPELLLAVVLTPEVLMEARMPIGFLIGMALIGVAAIVVSKRWFEQAELGGKPS